MKTVGLTKPINNPKPNGGNAGGTGGKNTNKNNGGNAGGTNPQKPQDDKTQDNPQQ